MDSPRFRFGLFQFDVASSELRRDGILVRLQAQPARVLACLVKNAGHVVSREQLRDAVWGRERFVDFERGLNFCMSQLRSALGDNTSEPTYIRTIPKNGYQFLAPVECITNGAPSLPDSARGATFRSRRPIMMTLAIVISGLAVVALATGLWLRSRASLRRPPVVAVVRFDNETDDSDVTSFSDALTDNVVEQLVSKSNGHYGVIGNARILRLPRDQRDLAAIGASLRAKYVVLGQVQRDGRDTRLLAHLIRLPDQTHLWVVRIERAGEDPSALGLEVAQLS
jgi:DNA-binding winged helix-turn-helix (wHTH) protein/TolB-like protein